MKIYTDNKKLIDPWWYLHTTFIDIEKDRWIYNEDFNEATIIPVTGTMLENWDVDFLKKSITDKHILMVLDLFDINDSGDYVQQLKKITGITDKIVYVHQNYKLKDDPRFVYFDCMWERQKLYFTDYNKIDYPRNCCWTINSSPEIYQLNPIDKQPIKKFLSPQRTYPGIGRKEKIRGIIQKFLESYVDQGYISYVGSGGSVIETNNPQITGNELSPTGGTWYPAADRYYNTSYFSVYAETLVHNNNAMCITEKTFDPLIKGNFILPFGYCGVVNHITDYYGFKLPTWIDYSYDSIEDDYVRLGKYLGTLEHLLNYSNDDLHNFYLKDKHILEYNRNIFYTRPYHRLYDRVSKFVSDRGLV